VKNMMTPKKPPYWNTKSSVDNTMQDINKLLQKYGVIDYQWTTIWSQNKVSLRFVMEEKKHADDMAKRRKKVTFITDSGRRVIFYVRRKKKRQ